MNEPPSFLQRLALSFSLFLRVLFDAAFAARAAELRSPAPALPTASEPPPPPEPKDRDLTPALQLLALLQREGRLVDFVRQDVAGFSDEDIGAAARVVHEGCRRALTEHVPIEPLRDEAEGDSVSLEGPVNSAEVKLVGKVSGSGPYRGTLRHRGWRATRISLPELVGTHDATVLAAAEVEL